MSETRVQQRRGGHWWWLRRAVCEVRGHIPDGVVRGGDDWNGSGGEMWCVRRCGWKVGDE